MARLRLFFRPHRTCITTHTYREAARVKGCGWRGFSQGFASILGALRGGSLAVFDGLMGSAVLCVAVLAVGIVLSEENPDRFSMANDPCF
ncbi:hypothetical protein [Mobiluncus mulieris]|uniref:hypothetical protein n=1 Tax=Mobiluncus mulieris TaxID=2052 RepID=UPI0021E269C1|nr:hypothetical protein [Mobiluncus mulieris]